MTTGAKIGAIIGGYVAAGIATMLLAVRKEKQAGQPLSPLSFQDPTLFALGVAFWPAAWYDEVKGQGSLGLLPQKKP